ITEDMKDSTVEETMPSGVASKIDYEDATHVEYEPIDPEEEKKLVRKLDMVIMPMMAFVYFFQYIDKQTINYAAIFGLKTDLKLTGDEFSWVVSLFYLGQLCSQWPAAYLLSRLPITIFVGGTIIAWGAVEMCLASPSNFGGMAAIRFFLGFTEGSVSPAFIIITSLWYKRSEHNSRVSTWVAMNGVAQIVAALLMYGIAKNEHSLAPWRVLFLVTGGMTVACGVVFVLWMPRSPSSAWFLNEKERSLAVRRLAADRGTKEGSDFNWAQTREALTTPTTWLYFLMALGLTLPTPIIKFSSTVINGFGFDTYKTMLVGLPAGVFSSGSVILAAILPAYIRIKYIRIYTGLIVTAIPLIGSALMTSLPLDASWGVVVATWLAGGFAGTLSISAGLMASNVKGNTKKSVVSTGFFVCYCVGCLVAPQAWQSKDAPRYSTGNYLSIGSLCLLFLTFIAYGVEMERRNRNRDRKAAQGDSRYLVTEADGVATGVSLSSDMTDIEDKVFRYRF
ncbi:unnamed protein product, partial [Clonostachys rosea]